jgi:ribokinase
VRAAVIGHVEWVEFVRVEELPQAGEIVQATETWTAAAGGGAVAAVQLVRLGAETTLYTALGDDELGRTSKSELERLGVRVCSVTVPQPQRRGFVHVDEAGERTITVIGEKLRPKGGEADYPWEELREMDCAYFTGGDVEALRKGRWTEVLVATARELPTLQRAGVELDALVASALDQGEQYHAGDLEPPPRLVVATSGALGGWAQPGGPFEAAVVSGSIEDTYGAGDCFAAGLTFALGRGDPSMEAIALGARCGATVVTGRGPYGRMLRADELGDVRPAP